MFAGKRLTGLFLKHILIRIHKKVEYFPTMLTFCHINLNAIRLGLNNETLAGLCRSNSGKQFNVRITL